MLLNIDFNVLYLFNKSALGKFSNAMFEIDNKLE